MEKITIFRGDDTDFTGNQEIVISIDTDIDITGYTAKFQFLNFAKSFDSADVETKELHIVIGSEDTKKFPLCEQFATLRIYDRDGKVKTLCNEIPVEVTNRACGIVLTDGEIRIRAHMKTNWENISGKPQIDDLPERFTDETMRDKVNELARKVSGRAVTMASALLFAFSAFCGLEVQTARKGDIYNDQHIVTNVTFDGGVGVDTNEVRTLVDASFIGGTNAVNLAVTGTVVTATNDIENLKSQKLDDDFTAMTNSVSFTNAVAHVSPKVDVVAPTNIAEYAGKAADARLTGVALTNRYTKAETDAKLSPIAAQLAEKRDKTDGDFTGTEIHMDMYGGSSERVVSIRKGGTLRGIVEIGYDVVPGVISLDSYESGKAVVRVGNNTSVPGEISVLSDRITPASIKKDGKEVATEEYVDGSISTNNPAFVSAVRNTPTSGMPDDMPTDWGTYGTVGAALAALAAFVKWAKAKIVAVIGDDGKPTDQFATDLLGKQVAKTALMIPLGTVEAGTSTITAEDGHAYAVTMTGTVTITMPETTEGKAAIFQARFSAAAQQSVQFDTDDVVKFDGTDCGIVKAGKDALLSAMWNGEAWDLVWKNEA